MLTRKYWVTRDNLPSGVDYKKFFGMSRAWRWKLRWGDNFVIRIPRSKHTRHGSWK